ncbi:hypothetical protein FFK22_012440 [Mycobacterium sp. KBS0706]|uniref:hypothetical protein n=1 Tax=Mycobacterium sp. KBS0706 TaxID=2578109 RepID=UPI00110FBDCF|nr:hypothetical protein [Mycobacterium sp. KBS0706]TSD88427.1 hypothetical protein FFK22_012440 [Mycobacterium sp. KBS0706]
MARAAAIALSCILLAAPVEAAPASCGPHDVVVDYLARSFQETPAGAGTANSGGRVELFAAPRGQSWTLIYTGPDGQACMIAAGRGWAPPLPGPNEETTKPR